MDPKELAQRVADKFEPPYWSEDRRTDLKPHELYKLPWEDRYVLQFHRKGPDDQPYVTFRAGDGHLSFRAATFREIVEATLEAVKDAENGIDVDAVLIHNQFCTSADCKFCKGRIKWDKFIS